MDNYTWAIMVGLILCAVLTGARVIEVLNGHQPTNALTAAFGVAITALVGLVAAGRSYHNGGRG